VLDRCYWLKILIVTTLKKHKHLSIEQTFTRTFQKSMKNEADLISKEQQPKIPHRNLTLPGFCHAHFIFSRKISPLLLSDRYITSLRALKPTHTKLSTPCALLASHTYTCTSTRAHTHTCTRTRAHTHTHTHTHTHKLTYTHLH
jgi:hypothetical protein